MLPGCIHSNALGKWAQILTTHLSNHTHNPLSVYPSCPLTRRCKNTRLWRYRVRGRRRLIWVSTFQAPGPGAELTYRSPPRELGCLLPFLGRLLQQKKNQGCLYFGCGCFLELSCSLVCSKSLVHGVHGSGYMVSCGSLYSEYACYFCLELGSACNPHNLHERSAYPSLVLFVPRAPGARYDSSRTWDRPRIGDG